jgi:cold shock protein
VPQGKVKWFSTEKAFGFIEQENDNDIFVHVTGLADGVTAIDKDQLVEYEVEQGRKGPQATNVRPASAPAAAAEVTETVEVVEVEDEAGDVVEEVVVEVEEEEEA